MGINMPSRGAIISELLPDRHLMIAISLNNSGMNLTRIMGPALAGFLILYIETSGAFLLVSVIYVLAAISVMPIRTQELSSKSTNTGVTSDIKEGVTYVISNPKLLGLIAMVLIAVLFGFSYWTLLPAWAVESPNVESDGLGVLMTFMGIGALAGTLGLAMISNTRYNGTLLLGSAFVWGILLAIFATITSYAMGSPITNNHRSCKFNIYVDEHDANTKNGDAEYAREDDEFQHDDVRTHAHQFLATGSFGRIP